MGCVERKIFMNRAKNIYECNKINNKKEYESYYETLFEDGNHIKLYNIKTCSITSYVVSITMDDDYYYIGDKSNNLFVNEIIEKIIINLKSEKFKNENNFNEKIKYVNSIIHLDNNKNHIRIGRNDIKFPFDLNTGNIYNVVFSFKNIQIEKKENGYFYSLNISITN